jgi:hypothetical protein
MAPAPEVRRLRPADLTALADPEDAESCRRLLAALPDTLRAGGRGGAQLGLYRVGELYIVAWVPALSPAELDALSRGDASVERPGETHVFGRDFRRIAIYPN